MSLLPKRKLEVDDIISYDELIYFEGSVIQRGMNFNFHQSYSVLLMSVRKNAPYADEFDKNTNTVIYEGHDLPKNLSERPKESDQPILTPKGSLTENGKFFSAASAYKIGLIKEPHKVKIYEKLDNGVWCYKGFFKLIDAQIQQMDKRKVFKFYLKPIELSTFKKQKELEHSRLIPTEIKINVWKRDKGKCVKCGSEKNLHYDHDLPFSKGGTSLTEKNVRILCMKCNLEKSNKIMMISL